MRKQKIKSALLNNRFTHLIPDKTYLSVVYFIKYHRFISWKKPQYFTEKLQWIKIYDRNAVCSELVDKIKVKDYIKKTAPELSFAKTIKVFSDDNIDFSGISLPYVVKCNHDSGSSIICRDQEPTADDKNRLKDHLKSNFYWNWREWPYKDIERHVFVEEYLSCSGTKTNDVKVYCFNGEPTYFYVYGSEDNKKTLDVYDINWVRTDIRHKGFINSKTSIEKPESLNLLIDYSRSLAKPFRFVRVDYVISNDDVFFSEITFFPSGGFFPFEDKKHDLMLGEKLNLNK